MRTLQELLNEEARASNLKDLIHEEIKNRRGNTPPPCWKQDDCSTAMLITCPWRIDCG